MISALYMLIIIISGQAAQASQSSLRVEIKGRPLTLAQCYKAGEDWQRRGPGYRYECKRIK